MSEEIKPVEKDQSINITFGVSEVRLNVKLNDPVGSASELGKFALSLVNESLKDLSEKLARIKAKSETSKAD